MSKEPIVNPFTGEVVANFSLRGIGEVFDLGRKAQKLGQMAGTKSGAVESRWAKLRGKDAGLSRRASRRIYRAGAGTQKAIEAAKKHSFKTGVATGAVAGAASTGAAMKYSKSKKKQMAHNILGMALGKVRNPLQDALTKPFRKKKTTVGGVLKGGLTGVRNESHLGLITPSKARKRKLISSAEQDAKKRGLVLKPVGSFR
jgi:hypothetical protein